MGGSNATVAWLQGIFATVPYRNGRVRAWKEFLNNDPDVSLSRIQSYLTMVLLEATVHETISCFQLILKCIQSAPDPATTSNVHAGLEVFNVSRRWVAWLPYAFSFVLGAAAKYKIPTSKANNILSSLQYPSTELRFLLERYQILCDKKETVRSCRRNAMRGIHARWIVLTSG